MIKAIGAALAALAVSGAVQGAALPWDHGGAGGAGIRAEPEVQPDIAPAPAIKARRSPSTGIPNVSLEESAADAFATKILVPQKTGAPLQVGFGRAVAALESDVAMGELISWEHAPGGPWIGAISVTSGGAAAIRLGLRIDALPAGSMLRFYAPDGAQAFEAAAADITATIDRNLLAGEPRDLALTYWSPVVEADTIALEIELPPGARPAEVRIAVPMVSHLVTGASSKFVMPKAVASCEIDATCYQGTWGAESQAVARIIFTRDGSSFVCTGTLLADKDPATFTPYFLTANHCISSQASASSIQSYWFYRSSGCDTGLRGNYQSLFGGATLLYNTENTDTALLRLNAAPPAGVGYAGWLVGSLPARFSPMTGIHHPSGELQKIAFGNLDSYWTCVPSGGAQFTCNGAAVTSATFFTVNWADGITEPGSSGSPVFLDNGHYLVGQLYGGTDSCTSATNRDWYGRFDVAYNAALHQWLGNTASSGPVFTPQLVYTGLWWNPSESGWGMSITQHNSGIFAAWYIYDSDGRPRWLVLPGGQWISATQFTGDLYSATGPDPRGEFNPAAVTRTRVGTATLSFSSPDRAQLSYSVGDVTGSRPLRRQLFGPAAPALAADYSDIWWNPSESGWGVSITQQHQTLFAVWYAYGADGQSSWYVLPGGAWISGDTYSGTLYRAASAPVSFLSGAFDPAAVTRTPVGTLALRFLNADSAVLSWSIDGVAGAKPIARQGF